MMTSFTNDRSMEGYIEILDRESDSDLESEYWISLSNFREVARHNAGILAEYDCGYQERFVASTGAERAIFEPFDSRPFILGCAENWRSSLGDDLFLTGGEEEEIWLIDSDGEQVAVLEIGDKVTKRILTAPLGGSYAFERIERRLLKHVRAAVRGQLLRVRTADWVLLVKTWTKQYISLLDTLLEVKKGTKAQILLRNRKRLVSADLSAYEK